MRADDYERWWRVSDQTVGAPGRCGTLLDSLGIADRSHRHMVCHHRRSRYTKHSCGGAAQDIGPLVAAEEIAMEAVLVEGLFVGAVACTEGHIGAPSR